MNNDNITLFRKELELSIFSCMELSKQSYLEILQMPIQRFYNYLKWKTELEDEKKKLMEENSKNV